MTGKTVASQTSRNLDSWLIIHMTFLSTFPPIRYNHHPVLSTTDNYQSLHSRIHLCIHDKNAKVCNDFLASFIPVFRFIVCSAISTKLSGYPYQNPFLCPTTKESTRVWSCELFHQNSGSKSRHPHHLGQHQTHHFRQHPEITHSSHFGRSLWATRISSLWATRKTSFLSSLLDSAI